MIKEVASGRLELLESEDLLFFEKRFYGGIGKTEYLEAAASVSRSGAEYCLKKVEEHKEKIEALTAEHKSKYGSLTDEGN